MEKNRSYHSKEPGMKSRNLNQNHKHNGGYTNLVDEINKNSGVKLYKKYNVNHRATQPLSVQNSSVSKDLDPSKDTIVPKSADYSDKQLQNYKNQTDFQNNPDYEHYQSFGRINVVASNDGAKRQASRPIGLTNK